MSDIIKILMKGCEENYISKRYANDTDYKKYAEEADKYSSSIRKDLEDSQKLDFLLNAVEMCNDIEKQYVFQDGIRFGYELHKIISDY